MYSTYSQYTDRGGQLPEDIYKKYSTRAGAEINRQTLGRAKECSDVLAAELAACECELIDTLDSYEKARGGLASESIDGYSYSVKADASADEKKAVRAILSCYLVDLSRGINLLYRGWEPC